MAIKSKSNATETPTPARKSSKADLFNSVTPSAGGVDFPTGEHEVIISALELLENDKGISVMVEYSGTVGEAEGKSIKQYYNLFDAEGELGKGAGFLKRDLAILGHEDVSFDDLESTFEEIVSEEIEVIVAVKQNGQYLNAYLQSTVD